ncbi:hypothetical protein BJG93_32830 (plasmid) [Paraburkholderia sprentiae WSM5005]|uniref:Uncharacterized protein n=1 Tax=Paraburkholderia sprentiae WSM5005 TaxID=754502 RepID=A0ACA8AXD1_9BURK|nr:hypothetical protein BJG93_32830 [Paraburkholderia sprentiae WSM5005]
MSVTLFLIAKLSRVEPDIARRAMSTASAIDEMEGGRPAEFSRGPNAMAFALALFVARRPVHFYLGLAGLVGFPVYILVRIGSFLIEWGMHAYGQ